MKGGGVWVVLPHPSAFVPLFSCIAVSQSRGPAPAAALSESSERGSRGEETPNRPGPCPVKGLPACGSRGAAAGLTARLPGSDEDARLGFSRGNLALERGGRAGGLRSGRGERARRWTCPPAPPCWGGFGASPAVGMVPKTSAAGAAWAGTLGWAPGPAWPPSPLPRASRRDPHQPPQESRPVPRSERF